MDHSDQINEVAAALSAAQAMMEGVRRTGINPHLRKTYATLDDIIAAVRAPLAANGLAFSQTMTPDDVMVTTLLHASGQYLSSAVRMPVLDASRGINSLQAFGSALTYMRRYTLTALLGVNAEVDDDGAAGESPPAKQPKRQSSSRPLQASDLRAFLHSKARNGSEEHATAAQAQYVARKFTECYAGSSNPSSSYHAALDWLLGVTSATALTQGQASALLDWLLVPGDPDGTGDRALHQHAPEEARRVLEEAQAQAVPFD